MGKVAVYGIGNPLIDVLMKVEDHELEKLGLNKGTMQLIDNERGAEILEFFKDRDKSYAPGGACPNTMVTLASLGVPTALSGVVGNDELADIYGERLRERGVESELTVEFGETGTSIVLVSADQERTMCTRLGVCPQFSPERVVGERVAQAHYLYFTGYMWDTPSQKNALLSAIATARENNTQVVFDVADPFAVERHRDDFLELVADHVDVVLANRDEAHILMGYDDPRRAVVELAEKAGVAAVKDGSQGSYIASHDGERAAIPGFEARAVDTTGAGDTYAAGILYGLEKSASLGEAGRIASFIAARIVEKPGAQFTMAEARNITSALEQQSWTVSV